MQPVVHLAGIRRLVAPAHRTWEQVHDVELEQAPFRSVGTVCQAEVPVALGNDWDMAAVHAVGMEVVADMDGRVVVHRMVGRLGALV